MCPSGIHNSVNNPRLVVFVREMAFLAGGYWQFVRQCVNDDPRPRAQNGRPQQSSPGDPGLDPETLILAEGVLEELFYPHPSLPGVTRRNGPRSARPSWSTGTKFIKKVGPWS